MKNQFKALAHLLLNENRFLIATHERPDGDALGSVFGLYEILQANNKTAKVLLPEPVPDNYRRFIPNGNEILTNVEPEQLADYSFCLCLDSSTPTRMALGNNLTIDNLDLPICNIDHHPDNHQFGKLNLVIPTMGATAEIIYQVVRTIDSWQIPSAAATHLLLGVIMDSGCFRFDNTSPEMLQTAAEMLELGADHHSIINSMYFSNPLPLLQFESELVSKHLKTACNGRYSWACIPSELLREFNIDLRNTEGLIDIIRSISGVEVAALLNRREDGVKFSLRSKNRDISVGEIARQLNGGGHELAAGGMIETTDLAVAEKLLLDLVTTKLS